MNIDRQVRQLKEKSLEELQAYYSKLKNDHRVAFRNISQQVTTLRARLSELRVRNQELARLLQTSKSNAHSEARLCFEGEEEQEGAFQVDLDSMSYEQILALEERIGKVSIGLTAAQLQDLKPDVCNSEEAGVCMVCQQEMATEQLVCQIRCMHKFHHSCIKEWLLQSKYCPACHHPAVDL